MEKNLGKHANFQALHFGCFFFKEKAKRGGGVHVIGIGSPRNIVVSQLDISKSEKKDIRIESNSYILFYREAHW